MVTEKNEPYEVEFVVVNYGMILLPLVGSFFFFFFLVAVLFLSFLIVL